MTTKLESILQTENLEALLPLFLEQGVTDSILANLTDDNLRDLGVTKLGERMRLLAAFARPTEIAVSVSEEKPPPTTPQSDFTYEASNGEITITGFRGKGHVVIPDRFDDLPLPVRHIGKEAFKDNGALLSIVIPEGVTIGSGSFKNCSSLKSVTLPESTTSLGYGAFAGCCSLNEIKIPDVSPDSVNQFSYGFIDSYISSFNVDSEALHLSTIDGILFDKEKKIILLFPSGRKAESYAIPESVTIIGHSAFSYCNNLASITIPDSVTCIRESAFSHCIKLTNITIPNSVTSIGHSAFSYCKNLASITIPDSVKSMGPCAFEGCDGLTSATLPGSLKSIPRGTLQRCKNLTQVELKEGVETIDECAFLSCENLTSVLMPNTLTYIENMAFFDCHAIKSTIPDSVTKIDGSAFLYNGTYDQYPIESYEKWLKRKNNPSLLRKLFG